MTLGPLEPSADMRGFAKVMHDMYEALRQEGFTQPEALTIVGEVIRAQFGAGGAT